MDKKINVDVSNFTLFDTIYDVADRIIADLISAKKIKEAKELKKKLSKEKDVLKYPEIFEEYVVITCGKFL